MSLPFSGLKVLECATVLAGPAVGAFFAELGAEVIKVEPPGGDVTRHWKRPEEPKDTTISAYFSAINWGKKSVVINLKHPAEREAFYTLVQDADVLIANYKPGAAEALGVDYDTLKVLNPALLYGHLTGYGLHNHRTGYDAIVQAESGFLYLNGHPGGPPAKMPVALMDVLAAHQLKEALLVGLYQRLQSPGQGGDYFSVSLLDSALVSLMNQATNWLVAGHDPEPMGLEHPNIVPYGNVFTTADQRQIMLAVGGDRHFQQLWELLQLTADPRFATNTGRLAHRETVNQRLAEAVSTQAADPFLKELWARGIPAGEIKTVSQALSNPHIEHLILRDRGFKGLRQNSFSSSLWPVPTLSAPPELNAHRHLLTQ